MIVQIISRETGIPVSRIQSVVKAANYKYRTYQIRKRTKGSRVIHHPSPDLKFLQRWLNRNIFSFFPIHNRAFAYRKGVSIKDNARLHSASHFLLKLDFSNFFPSILSSDVRRLLVRHCDGEVPVLEASDVDTVVRIVSRKGALTIGAPSSPMLSNAILYKFDDHMFSFCRDVGVTFSRYSDDLFFSSSQPGVLKDVHQEVRKYLKFNVSPRLELNQEKTVFTSRKRRRLTTGLVLTSEGEVSIGRSKKRSIRTLVYLYSVGDLPPDNILYLKGYLSFLNAVEPEFLVRLRTKYGNEVLDEILGEYPLARKL